MALYQDKGIEELQGKLDSFARLFSEKTGTELSRDELKRALEELFENKRRQMITQAFGTETVTTLSLFLEYFEALFPGEPAPVIVPEASQPLFTEIQVPTIKTKKRNSK